MLLHARLQSKTLNYREKKMESYNNFIGIDIGKFNFVVSVHGKKTTKEYENTSAGIDQFIQDFSAELPNALSVLEPTGGYELQLLLALCEQNYAVHRAHTRKVKNFIRSFGNEAKTDILDAKSLSLYGFERSNSLEKFRISSPGVMRLYEFTQRRKDLKQMLIAEKNRLKSPRGNFVRSSIEASISFLENELEVVTKEIEKYIKEDSALTEKKKVLKTIPGIGNLIANDLIVLLPELGRLSRREIASLAGLAPISKESGKFKGYRRTGHGREGIKPMLFLAAMAARNSKSHLRVYYENLLSRGKNKMVALTALMRKILVIANAKIKTMT
jgi:transposase